MVMWWWWKDIKVRLGHVNNNVTRYEIKCVNSHSIVCAYTLHVRAPISTNATKRFQKNTNWYRMLEDEVALSRSTLTLWAIDRSNNTWQQLCPFNFYDINNNYVLGSVEYVELIQHRLQLRFIYSEFKLYFHFVYACDRCANPVNVGFHV